MSHIIFFVSTLIALSIAVSAVSVALKGLSYAMSQRAEVSAQQVSTVVKVVDAGYDTNTSTLTVYMKNLGSTTLDLNKTDLFVDGKFVGTCGTELNCVDRTGDGLLVPDELAELNAQVSLSPGVHRIRVVTQYGVYADYEVVIE